MDANHMLAISWALACIANPCELNKTTCRCGSAISLAAIPNTLKMADLFPMIFKMMYMGTKRELANNC